ncbi:aspartate kinase [Dissoconium aciculare CBS 342.82]|uniref:aspartate kinase n=1 Tax=Dissoconium aciculare CBS 342.82 TaxID=1314786 RepID=A0A6J3M6L6_9PEZI|nr:aspartate kinase [Dissoconium aciculare CBS 342.82]KAF1823159.1 aspartate kinase [Dissoconium aciculare CBS 342.82]
MDFQVIRREHPQLDATRFINGIISQRPAKIVNQKPYLPPQDMPKANNWIVQKFGGTSVGKFPLKIAEDIILAGLKPGHRIAVVCSARSSTIKSEGTTTRLVRAAHDVLDPHSSQFREIVETIQNDHLQAGKDACNIWGSATHSEIYEAYSKAVNAECQTLLKILEAAQYLRAVTDRTEDMVISVGEKLSCLYMAALLQTRGVPAAFVDLSDVISPAMGENLNETFYQQLGEAIAKKIAALGPDTVPVITGYFGCVPGGLLKEVGRGYTDLCAALTAVGLKARELQIWKEVDGIFTADPRKVPTARLLDSVTPAEAAELTFYGSEVIHPFTMDQVIRASIPIRIKNVMNPRGNGTIVRPDPTETPGVINNPRKGFFRSRSLSYLLAKSSAAGKQPKRPTAVTIKRGITVLNVHSKKRTRAHGFLASIFRVLDQFHLSVDLISSSEVHVSMALHSERSLLSCLPHPASPGSAQREPDDLHIESAALQGAVDALQGLGDIDLLPNMAIISLVGRQLRTMIGISGKFFSTLGENGVNIEMISQGASEINISCVIAERDTDRALNVVHTNLFTFLE